MNGPRRCSDCGRKATPEQPDGSGCSWSLTDDYCAGRIIRVPWVPTRDMHEISMFMSEGLERFVGEPMSNSVRSSVRDQAELTVEALECARFAMDLIVPLEPEVRVLQSNLVPLNRKVRDEHGRPTGRVEPILFMQIDGDIVVHPERWHLFQRVLNNMGRGVEVWDSDAGQADDESK